MIKLVKGDITKDLEVGAIVNAANDLLKDGGGVCGAIHKAAGHRLELYNQAYNKGFCDVGEAKISPSFEMQPRVWWIIHTVGPDLRGCVGGPMMRDEQSLAACYRNSLHLAIRFGIKDIAFPSISTGIFGYPIEEAAPVAIEAVTEVLLQRDINVTFCLFSDNDLGTYARAMRHAK